jgi:transcriptional antiterminator
MSHERNIQWLNDRKINYRRDPITDTPDIDNESYMYFANGTYEYYRLFYTPSKITTYKSLKWHMLVLYYLNIDNIINSDFVTLAKFIANKENGFVTFFIKNKLLENMIRNVLMQGGDPPVNRKRKIIFKDYSGLSFEQKMKIVGQLSGRQKLDKEKIYDTMLYLNDYSKPITNGRLAGLLDCSIRTIQRHMCADLKQEKQRLNEEI